MSSSSRTKSNPWRSPPKIPVATSATRRNAGATTESRKPANTTKTNTTNTSRAASRSPPPGTNRSSRSPPRHAAPTAAPFQPSRSEGGFLALLRGAEDEPLFDNDLQLQQADLRKSWSPTSARSQGSTTSRSKSGEARRSPVQRTNSSPPSQSKSASNVRSNEASQRPTSTNASGGAKGRAKSSSSLAAFVNYDSVFSSSGSAATASMPGRSLSGSKRSEGAQGSSRQQPLRSSARQSGGGRGSGGRGGRGSGGDESTSEVAARAEALLQATDLTSVNRLREGEVRVYSSSSSGSANAATTAGSNNNNSSNNSTSNNYNNSNTVGRNSSSNRKRGAGRPSAAARSFTEAPNQLNNPSQSGDNQNNSEPGRVERSVSSLSTASAATTRGAGDEGVTGGFAVGPSPSRASTTRRLSSDYDNDDDDEDGNDSGEYDGVGVVGRGMRTGGGAAGRAGRGGGSGGSGGGRPFGDTDRDNDNDDRSVLLESSLEQSAEIRFDASLDRSLERVILPSAAHHGAREQQPTSNPPGELARATSTASDRTTFGDSGVTGGRGGYRGGPVSRGVSQSSVVTTRGHGDRIDTGYALSPQGSHGAGFSGVSATATTTELSGSGQPTVERAESLSSVNTNSSAQTTREGSRVIGVVASRGGRGLSPLEELEEQAGGGPAPATRPPAGLHNTSPRTPPPSLAQSAAQSPHAAPLSPGHSPSSGGTPVARSSGSPATSPAARSAVSSDAALAPGAPIASVGSSSSVNTTRDGPRVIGAIAATSALGFVDGVDGDADAAAQQGQQPLQLQQQRWGSSADTVGTQPGVASSSASDGDGRNARPNSPRTNAGSVTGDRSVSPRIAQLRGGGSPGRTRGRELAAHVEPLDTGYLHKHGTSPYNALGSGENSAGGSPFGSPVNTVMRLASGYSPAARTLSNISAGSSEHNFGGSHVSLGESDGEWEGGAAHSGGGGGGGGGERRSVANHPSSAALAARLRRGGGPGTGSATSSPTASPGGSPSRRPISRVTTSGGDYDDYYDGEEASSPDPGLRNLTGRVLSSSAPWPNSSSSGSSNNTSGHTSPGNRTAGGGGGGTGGGHHSESVPKPRDGPPSPPTEQPVYAVESVEAPAGRFGTSLGLDVTGVPERELAGGIDDSPSGDDTFTYSPSSEYYGGGMSGRGGGGGGGSGGDSGRLSSEGGRLRVPPTSPSSVYGRIAPPPSPGPPASVTTAAANYGNLLRQQYLAEAQAEFIAALHESLNSNRSGSDVAQTHVELLARLEESFAREREVAAAAPAQLAPPSSQSHGSRRGGSALARGPSLVADLNEAVYASLSGMDEWAGHGERRISRGAKGDGSRAPPNSTATSVGSRLGELGRRNGDVESNGLGSYLTHDAHGTHVATNSSGGLNITTGEAGVPRRRKSRRGGSRRTASSGRRSGSGTARTRDPRGSHERDNAARPAAAQRRGRSRGSRHSTGSGRVETATDTVHPRLGRGTGGYHDGDNRDAEYSGDYGTDAYSAYSYGYYYSESDSGRGRGRERDGFDAVVHTSYGRQRAGAKGNSRRGGVRNTIRRRGRRSSLSYSGYYDYYSSDDFASYSSGGGRGGRGGGESWAHDSRVPGIAIDRVSERFGGSPNRAHANSLPLGGSRLQQRREQRREQRQRDSVGPVGGVASTHSQSRGLRGPQRGQQRTIAGAGPVAEPSRRVSSGPPPRARSPSGKRGGGQQGGRGSMLLTISRDAE